MEDFFEDLGNTLKKTAETVEKKTNDFISVQKLRSRISSCERKTERNFRDLGEIVFGRFVDGECMDGETAAICDEILELQKELALYREQLAARRGLCICPACGAHVPKEAAFCMHCGAPIPKTEETKEEEPAAAEEPADDDKEQTEESREEPAEASEAAEEETKEEREE